MELKTKRLLLRPPRMMDIDEIIEGAGNLEVSKWLLVVPHPYKRKDVIDWIKKKQKQEKQKKKENYQFGIILRENNAYIGGIGIHHIDMKQGTAEVGYWISQSQWKKGYGSEALEAVLDFAFNKLKLRRLEAGVIKGNPGSRVLLEKFGFKLEGTKRRAIIPKSTGKITDEHIYGLLKE